MADKENTNSEAKGEDKASSRFSEAGRKLERFRTAGLVIVQMVLILVVFSQVNYLSCRRHVTWDLSQNRRFTLSDTSVNYLKNSRSKVTMVMAFLGTADLYSDVKGLISEYDRLGGDAVSAEFLDLSRSRARLTELSDKYQLQFSRNQVLILGENGRIKTVGAEELVTRDANSGRVIEFRGEEVLTAALLEVNEQQQRKVYLISGDRRADELVPIATQLQPLTNSQNARLESLNLEGLLDIPADADALLFAGSTSDVTERELELIRSYYDEKQGGIVVFLDPRADTPNLNSLLREHGVGPNPDRVLSVINIPGVAEKKTYDVPVALMPGNGPTKELPALSTRLAGQTQSIAVLEQDDLLVSENIHPQPLMIAGNGFWGETDFQAEDVSYNPDVDTGRPNPVYTAASVEKGLPGDPGFLEGSSRMVVVGNPNLISPDGNTAKVAADFTMAAINWVMNREELIGISPRSPTAYTLNISPADFGMIQAIMIFAMPCLALIVGMFVWMKRRA